MGGKKLKRKYNRARSVRQYQVYIRIMGEVEEEKREIKQKKYLKR